MVGSKAAQWKRFTKVAQGLNEKKKCTGKCNFCGHQSYREEIGPLRIPEHRDFGFGPERGKRQEICDVTNGRRALDKYCGEVRFGTAQGGAHEDGRVLRLQVMVKEQLEEEQAGS
mgnify:CR=1 FL=1